MSLTEKEFEKLDMKSEHDAMLETAETLEALAKIADDPTAYDPVLFDAAYTRAEQLAHSFCGMMMGLRAAEIAATFRRAVKARKACEKYDLVPETLLLCARAEIATLREALHAADASFGPGDPFPDPPPTKPLMPQTGEELWGMLIVSHPGEYYAPWGDVGATTAEIMERLVVILNGKPAQIGAPTPASIGPGDSTQ